MGLQKRCAGLDLGLGSEILRPLSGTRGRPEPTMTENSSMNDKAAEQPEPTPEQHAIGAEIPRQDDVKPGSSLENSEFLHSRLRVLQPIVDTFKFLLKNNEWPATKASWVAVSVAPLLVVAIALLTYLLLPIGPAFQVTDINIGLLFILGMISLEIYGAVLGNWGRDRRYSLGEALRAAVQVLSSETALALGLVSALLLSGSLSMKEVVQAQLDQGQWFIFYVPVGFLFFFAGSIMSTNRARIDSPETDPESVEQHVPTIRDLRWALDSLADYAGILMAAGIATTVFLGGWLRPLASYRDRFPGTSVELLDVLPGLLVAAVSVYSFRSAQKPQLEIRKVVMNSFGGICVFVALALLGSLFARETITVGVHGAFWFVVKVGAYVYCCFWMRFMFPGLRVGQSMRVGWRILVPVAFVNLITAAVAIVASQNTGLPMRFTTIVATVTTLGAAAWLAYDSPAIAVEQTADGE
jgi:NADH-quinone oxidoreductase subunit H